MNVLELLKQRRVWAGLVGVVAFATQAFGLGLPIDIPVLTDLLSSFGEALATLVMTGLALWSYFKPKE